MFAPRCLARGQGLRQLFADVIQQRLSLFVFGNDACEIMAQGFIIYALQNHCVYEPPHAALQRRIFERFFRTDDAHTTPGFGLGLPMARAIVEAHGGSIDVASAPGAGTIFTVQLPARSSASSAKDLPHLPARLSSPLRPTPAPAVEMP